MDQERTILFICEHGAAKSVVAAAYFNRLANERKIGWHAFSRGTNPDTAISPNAARGLAADGMAAASPVPARLTPRDIEAAVRIVAFSPVTEGNFEKKSIEIWDDVPVMSDDYDHARDAIVERIGRLVDQLAEPVRTAEGGAAS